MALRAIDSREDSNGFQKKILENRWVTAEKNENENQGDFGTRSGQNLKNLNMANSLGNHTVNNLHIFRWFLLLLTSKT